MKVTREEFNEAMLKGIQKSRENNKTVSQLLVEVLDMIDRAKRGEVL